MINVAELLKDAPKGTKLYSPLFGEVRFVCVNCDNNILIETEMHDNHYFAYNGVFRMPGCYPHSECLLFPSKDCRTWEGWKLPIEPKFKVGDSLQSGSMWAIVRRIDTENQRYICQFDNVIPFEEQERWNFVPKPKKHYDIANFKPKQWVLVRDDDEWGWALTRFSHLSNGSASLFVCINGASFQQCIPYEGNEHLIGTTEPCSEEFINW